MRQRKFSRIIDAVRLLRADCLSGVIKTRTLAGLVVGREPLAGVCL